MGSKKDKDIDKIMDSLKRFFNTCDISLAVPGMFDIKKEVFLTAFEEYLHNGINRLNEYTKLLNIGSDVDDYARSLDSKFISHSLTEDKVRLYQKYMENEGFWNIFAMYSENEIKNINDIINGVDTIYKDRVLLLEQINYRNTPEYKRWRKSVFKRDDYTCQDCLQEGGALEAHHVHPFKKYPKERYDINNGKTLCIFCHRKTHMKAKTNG